MLSCQSRREQGAVRLIAVRSRVMTRRFCVCLSLSVLAVLLTLGHSSYTRRNPDYQVLVRDGVERLVARGRPFFFISHPRETDADHLCLAGLPLAREVPRSLPVVWISRVPNCTTRPSSATTCESIQRAG